MLTNSPVGAAALSYAGRGLPVLPLHSPTANGKCTCDDGLCGSPGKHPRTSNGPKDATVDLECIRSWWTKWPTANVGVATGARAGVIVLDVDGPEGSGSLRSYSPLPVTWRATTGRGEHLWLQHPGGVVRNFARRLPGLDLRADGGYVVAPPSLHALGERYRWVVPPDEVTLAHPPDWLLDLIRTKPGRHDSSPSGPTSWANLLQGVPQGQRHDTVARVAGHYIGIGRRREEVAAMVIGFASRCSPPLDPAEAERIVSDLVIKQAATQPRAPTTCWANAVTASELVRAEAPVVAWLHEPLLAPGSITELFSPRGIGKTHIAHGLAVGLARSGKRVLLLDRDNSLGEIQRRLRAWGAAGAPNFKVMSRHQVPRLTEPGAWVDFPFAEYDIVIIDSLDASAEGVGEKDSAKPSRAIAPILDIAHREGGPAILVLANTVKSAEHGRGSGVVEDRADICFEVRDATGLEPSGTRDWWHELAPAGAKDWRARASTRRRRDRYRLAFVQSKFRVGEEPDPFIMEIDLSGEPWAIHDVTAEVLQIGEAARALASETRRAMETAAVAAIVAEVHRRAASDMEGLNKEGAEEFLAHRGLTRVDARRLIEAQNGVAWRIEVMKDRRGKPHFLRPVNSSVVSENSAPTETARNANRQVLEFQSDSEW